MKAGSLGDLDDVTLEESQRRLTAMRAQLALEELPRGRARRGGTRSDDARATLLQTPD